MNDLEPGTVWCDKGTGRHRVKVLGMQTGDRVRLERLAGVPPHETLRESARLSPDHPRNTRGEM
jgi:hypothetical protein